MTPPPDQPAPQSSPESPHAPEPEFQAAGEESQFAESGAAVVHGEQDFREAELSSDLDVVAAHRREPVKTERGSANTNFVAVPTWLLVAFGGVMLWAGVYLGNYSGGFKADVFNEQPGMKGGGPPVPPDPVKIGEKLFNANCAQWPPADWPRPSGSVSAPGAASEWVLENPSRLGHILMRGIQGSIRVKGAVYNNQMPAWNTLKDEQVSSILTYIRQAWGNSAPAITKDQIAAARKESEAHTEAYTEAELLKIQSKEEAGGPQKQSAGPPAGTTQPDRPGGGQSPAGSGEKALTVGFRLVGFKRGR